MELRHLRYFIAVAEEEHMTRAASRLFIQQPPLSQQIRALEDHLGVVLFKRIGKRIELNAAGRLFLAESREILQRVDAAVDRVRRFDLGEEGLIRVGYTSSASMHELTPCIIREFRNAHPLVALQIEEGAAHDLLCAVEENRLDVAFVRSSVDQYARLDCVGLIQEEMVVAIPIHHRLAQNAGLELELTQLREEPFIVYRQVNGSGINEMVVKTCLLAGFEPRVSHEVHRMMAAINLVAAGLGVTVVPQSLATIQPGSVVYRPLRHECPVTVPLNLAYRASLDTPASEGFVRLSRALADRTRLKTV